MTIEGQYKDLPKVKESSFKDERISFLQNLIDTIVKTPNEMEFFKEEHSIFFGCGINFCLRIIYSQINNFMEQEICMNNWLKKQEEIKEKIDETMKNSISFRGLWEDKENYPKDMGSGIGGLIKEGDLWCCPQPKLTIYKTDFRYICSIMAKCDNPGQNSSNWNVNIAGVSKIT